MSRYIDADKLVAHLEDEIVRCNPPFGSRAYNKSIAYGTTLGLRSAIAFATTLPTANVATVRRGEWLRYGQDDSQCSLCGAVNTNCIGNNYCHNCGARMRGENNEQR